MDNLIQKQNLGDKEQQVDSLDLSNLKNPPKITDLKQNFKDALPIQQTQVAKINTWLDNLNITGGAIVKSAAGKSQIVPKLIRKQAEWRYSSLSEPFLSTEDIFNVDPVTFEDKEGAVQNSLVLNHQLNTKIDKVKFVDEYIRTAVDEGTVIVRVGWEYEDKIVKVEVPDFKLVPIEDPAQLQQHQQLHEMMQQDPEAFAAQVPPELQQAHQIFIQTQGMQQVQVGVHTENETKIVRNEPTLEVVNTKNVVIDPTCDGNLDKANFIVYSFETSLSQLKDKLNSSELQITLKDELKTAKTKKQEYAEELKSFYSTRRLLNNFLKHFDINKYDAQQQLIIKSNLPSLFKENKFKSDKQATAFSKRQINSTEWANKKFQLDKISVFFLGQNAKINKIETLINYFKIDNQDAIERIYTVVENELNRREKFFTSEKIQSKVNAKITEDKIKADNEKAERLRKQNEELNKYKNSTVVQEVEGFLGSRNIHDLEDVLESSNINVELAIIKNNGYTLDKTPEGKESDLFKSILNLPEVNGNVEIAKKLKSLVYSEDFTNWFGDWLNNPEESSKIVDENGEPKLVYHGSGREFDNFEEKERGSTTGKWKDRLSDSEMSFMFTDSPTTAFYYAIIERQEILKEITYYVRKSAQEPTNRIIQEMYQKYPAIKNWVEGLKQKGLTRDEILKEFNRVYKEYNKIRDLSEGGAIGNKEANNENTKQIINYLEKNKKIILKKGIPKNDKYNTAIIPNSDKNGYPIWLWSSKEYNTVTINNNGILNSFTTKSLNGKNIKELSSDEYDLMVEEFKNNFIYNYEKIQDQIKAGGFKPKVYPVFLNAKNINQKDFKGRPFVFQQGDTEEVVSKRESIGAAFEVADLIEEALNNNLNGSIIENIADPTVSTNYAVFRSYQIKSIFNKKDYTSQDNFYNQISNGKIIGQANIKAMTVLVDAVNKKADTIPHEYAHHYIAWFRDTPIVKEGIKRFGSEEALVQAIGEQVVKQKGEAYNWWKKFTNWMLNLLSDKQLLQVLTDSFLNRQDLHDFTYNQEVEELFDSNPELANIGTPEQYSQYLDTIFPDSKVKDIVYHGSKNKIDKVSLEKTRESQLLKYPDLPTVDAFFLTPSKITARAMTSEEAFINSALINSKNPLKVTTSLVKENNISTLAGTVLFTNSPEMISKYRKLGYDSFDSSSNAANEYVVFEPEQIHILGGKQDIEGFRNYVNNTFNSSQEVEELFDSNPELANEVYEAVGLINTSEIQLNKPRFNPDNTEATSYPIKINSKYAGVISVDKDGYISSSIGMAGVELEKEFQGKGYGTKVYIALAEQLAKEGKTLKSEAFGKNLINESANRVWKSLLDKGYVVDRGSYFEVQLKDKQQAQQQYSQYLEQNPNGNIEGFKEFVRNQTKPSFNRKVAPKTQKEIYDTINPVGKISKEGDDYIVLGEKGYTRVTTITQKNFGLGNKDTEMSQFLGNVFHAVAANAVKEAFPDFNKHFKAIESVDAPENKQFSLATLPSVSKNNILAIVRPVIEAAKKSGSVLSAELMTANTKTKIAGTIDLLEITKDGETKTLDYKTSMSKGTAKSNYKKLLGNSEQQILYKRILDYDDSNLGREGLNVKYQELMKILSYVKDGVPTFKVLETSPVIYQSSIDKKKNEMLGELFTQIKMLDNKKDKANSEKINALIEAKLKLMQSIQKGVKDNDMLAVVMEDLIAIEVFMSENKSTNSYIEFRKDLSIYGNIGSFIHITKDNTALIEKIQGRAKRLYQQMYGNIEEHFAKNAAKDLSFEGSIINSPDDVLAPVKDINTYQANFKGASYTNNPVIAYIYKTVTTALAKARKQSTEMSSKINKAVRNLENYTGFKGEKIYEPLLQYLNGKPTGYLVDKYSSVFYEERKKAKKNGDLTWFKDNTKLDTETYEKRKKGFVEYLANKFNADVVVKIKKLKDSKKYKEEIIETEAKKYVTKDHNTLLTKWIKDNNNIMLFNIPVDKWIDPKWKDIKEGKYKGTPVEEFYDMYTSTMESIEDFVPFDIRKNYIAEFKRSFMERIITNGVGDMKLGESLMNSIIMTSDDSYLEVNPFTGKYERNIPILGKMMIPFKDRQSFIENDKSYDLGKSLTIFFESAMRYHELSLVEHVHETGRDILLNQKEQILTASGEEAKGGFNLSKTAKGLQNSIDSLDYFIQSTVYGKSTDEGSSFNIQKESFVGKIFDALGMMGDKTEANISSVKLLDSILRYTGLNNLGYNLYSPITNLLGGKSMQLLMGVGGRWYDTKDYAFASSVVSLGPFSNITEDARKARLFIDMFQLQSDEYALKDRESNSTGFKAFSSIPGPMSGMTSTESHMQNAGLIAMIKSNKHSIKWDDWKVVNDTLEYIGKEKLDISVQEAFRQKVIHINGRALGNMNPDDKIKMKQFFLGRAITQHRGWIPAMLESHWSTKRYDYILGEYVEGRFNTLIKFITVNKMNWKNLSNEDKANVREAMAEISIIVSSYGLYTAVAGADADKERRKRLKYQLKVLSRYKSEMMFFSGFGFSDMHKILISPAPSISTIEKFGRLLGNIKETVVDEEPIKEGKLTKSVGQMVPYWSQTSRFFDDITKNELNEVK